MIWASPRFRHPHSQKPSDMGIPFLYFLSDLGQVRVTGDAYIPRVGEWGLLKRRDTHITVTSVLSVHNSLRGGRKKLGGMGEKGEEKRLSQFPFPQSTTLFDTCFTVWFPYTVETRYDEGLSDWQNLFAITRFLFIEVLFRTFLYYYWGKGNCSLYRGLRYIEVRCSIMEVSLYGGPIVGVRFIDVSVRELIVSQRRFIMWSQWKDDRIGQLDANTVVSLTAVFVSSRNASPQH